jgi:DNA-directed RNA polymerase specialized sigma subunit
MKQCTDCLEYKQCKEPCREVEAYINQDDNADAWIKIRPSEHIEQWGAAKMPDNVSTTEVILQNYFIDRMQPKEIAEKHYKSKQYVYRIIKKYSAIITENIKKAAKTG